MELTYPDIKDVTEDSIRAEDLAIFQAVFPELTNLNSGGPSRRLLELLSRGKYEVYKFLDAQLLPQLMWRTATDAWLDMKAAEEGLERLEATKALGKITLSREESAGSAVVPKGGQVGTDIDPTTQTRQIFRVKENAVAGDGQAEIIVPVEALDAGAAGNVGVGAISQFITGFEGWDAVTNASDWLTVEGRDEEEDGRTLDAGEPGENTTGLRLRIHLAKQAGNRCNFAQYKLLAYTAGAKGVRLAQTRGAGTVDIVISGPTGIPTAALIAAVEAAYNDPEYGMLGTDGWQVYSPNPVPVNWEMNLVMNPGQAADEDGIIATALNIINAYHNPSVVVTGVAHTIPGRDVITQQVFQYLRVGGLGGLKSVQFTTTDQVINTGSLAVIGAEPVITVSEASEI